MDRAHPSTANQVMRAGSFCTKKVKPSTKSAATLVCGFTLIEVVVVSAVALVLGQAAIPRFLGFVTGLRHVPKQLQLWASPKNVGFLRAMSEIVLESSIRQLGLLWSVISPVFQ